MIFDIKRDFVKNQTQKKLNQKKDLDFIEYKNEIPHKNNLMENYLNGKINKRKESYNTASYKKNNYYAQISNIPKDIARALKYTNDNITSDIKISNNTNNTLDINSLININFNSTVNNNNNIINNKSKNRKQNNTTNGIYYVKNNKNNYKQANKHSGQKPIILCYDQMKYDSYFVTPKNTKKLIKKGKVQTSNKSTKIDSNSGGIKHGTSSTNNKNNDYNIISNPLLRLKNKSFNKYINNNRIIYINNNNNRIIYINNNTLKNHKSSSLLIKQNGVLSNTKGTTSQNSNIKYYT